jgi:hypothetical protein
MTTTYKIQVKSIHDRVLTYSVDSYVLRQGLITFYDKIDKVNRSFPLIKCEIEEVSQ